MHGAAKSDVNSQPHPSQPILISDLKSHDICDNEWIEHEMRPGPCLGLSSSSLELGEVDGASVFGEPSHMVGSSLEHWYGAVVAKVSGHAPHAQLGRWRNHFCRLVCVQVRPGFLDKEHGDPTSRFPRWMVHIDMGNISRNQRKCYP